MTEITCKALLLSLVALSWSLLQVSSNKINRSANSEVRDLSAESSFRTVKLSWNYYADNEQDPVGFSVKFCELSVWNTNVRCRERLLKLNGGRLRNKINLLNKLNSPIEPANAGEFGNAIKRTSSAAQGYDKLIRKNKYHYEAYIYDLRTLTNYTFQVTAEQFDQAVGPALSSNLTSIQSLIKQNLKDKAQAIKNKPLLATTTTLDQNVRSIQIETKGFSARTDRCLSNLSEVIVNTGPLFNGKISVENSTSEECAVYGNRSIAQEAYHLIILHDRCGSKRLNNSRFETMIIVHENKDILTHNARRFLVVCTFMPESYTLKASVSMPMNLLKRRNPFGHQQFGGNQQFAGNSLSPTLYAISRVDPASIDNLFASESSNSTDQLKPNEIGRNKRPTIINRIQRNNHPGTLQEQFFKQKQQYLNSYLLNSNRLANNSELNNEVVYNFERLPKSARDSRILLSNQPQHSIVYNTQRERQNTQFQNYFTMTMVAVGSTCLFIIIIFNFISIPKIWSNQPEYYRRRHQASHRHYYKEQRKEQENRSKRNREYRDYRLSLNKHYQSSFNSLSSISNSSYNHSSFSGSSYQQQDAVHPHKPKASPGRPLKQIGRYSSSSFSSVV